MVLSLEKKEEILRMYDADKTQNQIAAEVGCSPHTVSRVINGTTAEDNKQYSVPQSTWDKWDTLHKRYGENGTHRAQNRLRTGR
ncbi:helix-turn-helix domain-containing protein [Robinsoniella peoriensis]